MTIRSVFKYPLTLVDFQTVMIPKNAQVLCVQMQDSQPCLWALTDDSPKIERRFMIAGTGHVIDIPQGQSIHFIDTVQMSGGRLVWHVFEVSFAKHIPTIPPTED